MKKFLTIVAIFMTMLCGSVFLVSCSNNYKKMYLVVEYALPTEDGKDVEWNKIDADTDFDYVLSQSVYSGEDNSHILYLRVKVKGTSKKVDSLYISQSANNSTFLQSNVVKPDEAFKVLVKNIGSVRFTVTPSQGGEDKAVSFGVNVYKELTSMSQNTNCVPAVVTGGYIRLENLTHLIKYEPVGETNQTGVDFSLVGIGSLTNNGTSDLINRPFVNNSNYTIKEDVLLENINDANDYITLDSSRGFLMLNISTGYKLTTANNVIKLRATSRYHKDIFTDVYVYIVENFTSNSLLVSYSPDIQLENGNLPTQEEDKMSISNEIVIYNSIIDGDVVDSTYNSIPLYTYTNSSIYSYESNPGRQLKVFINGIEYNYNDVVNNAFGIQISPINKDMFGESRLIGLKFEVNPNSYPSTNIYNIRLEVDFTSFDFTASDKAPVSVLNKEFVIKVESLASGFHINGKGYSDNLQDFSKGEETTINEYNSTKTAKLYTTYDSQAIGMPLDIQATPTNAIDTRVHISFYDSPTLETNLASKLELVYATGIGITPNNGEFVLEPSNRNKIVYLRFNELENIKDIEQVYMVCKVVCTPNSFGLKQNIDKQYITFVARIDVAGSIDDMYVYKYSTDNISEDTLTDPYMANATTNTAYINFRSNSASVDWGEIEITSVNGNIKFSSDEVNWNSKITADLLNNITTQNGVYKVLHFRTETQCVDGIKISSPNGINRQLKYQFVNVTSSQNVELRYDDTYVWESSTIDSVNIQGVTTENVTLKYLALQLGRTTQFKAFGDNKNSTIQGVTAKSLYVSSSEYDKIIKDGNALYTTPISSFSASAIRVSNSGGYLFDVSGNSDGFTAILLVKVDFYAMVTVVGDTKIEPQSKYFVYEVAVYTPARELKISSDKDSIIYINEYYPDTARVDFNVELNKATRSISFSSTAVNNSINQNYGVEGANSLYGIAVQPSEKVFAKDSYGNSYFKVNGLNTFEISYINESGNPVKKDEEFINISSRSFSVQALQRLSALQEEGINSISFKLMIYQFGREVITTEITKVIYFGNYNKANTIIVSGVENYSNIYLSLGGKATQTIEAYASNEDGNVTYKDLGYNLYQVNQTNGTLINYTGKNLTITHNSSNNTFEIKATNAGGVYQLVLYAKDSHNGEVYAVQEKINITVSDGLTDATAFLIRDLDDFVSLTQNTSGKYYRLWQDIDISALSDPSTNYYNDWWRNARTFAGTLDGAMTIEDPNTGRTIYRYYTLKNLRLSNYNLLGDANCFGLFSEITGIIQNIVFDNVIMDITLDSNNTSSSNSGAVNIGVITAINSGTIANCSVNIGNSSIKFTTTAQKTTYNIGLIAGLNNKDITYENINTTSNYSRIVDVVSGGDSAGKLTITVDNNGDKNLDTANLYIGGVVGKNAAEASISADYVDGSSKSVRELITAVVNIELKVGYKVAIAPMSINAIDLGGVAGLNAGKISNIAISGSLVANDKVNMGGVAGENINEIKDVVNYGTYIEGYSLNDTLEDSSKYTGTLTYFGEGATQEQNIGGIVGYNNAGLVDNVRIMFIVFTKDEVAIASNSAEIIGVGNVAGVIGKANNTQLKRAYVENFITNVDNANLTYNIIGNKANVAGLVADSSSSSAILSFVQASFSVEDCTFNEFGNGLDFAYVYFVGDVLSNNLTADNELNNHTTLLEEQEGKAYIVNNVVYNNGEAIVKNIVKYGVDKIVLNTNIVEGDFTIQWRQSDEEGVNSNYPYLVYIVDNIDYYTLTIRPTDIIVNVDETYFSQDASSYKLLEQEPGNWTTNWTEYYTYIGNEFVKLTDATAPTFEEDKYYQLILVRFEKYDDGIYLQYVNDLNTPDDNSDDIVEATAIVYYIEGADNVHKLVSEGSQKGLIEKAVLPNISSVNGSHSVSIISGSNIATLINGDSTIAFKGVGKVELKFVSLFDRTKTDTVVIFVENPIHNDVFGISASAGLEDRNQDGKRFTTRVGVNSLLSLSLNSVDGQIFDSTKTYMTSSIDYSNIIADGNNVTISATDLAKYFTLKPVTETIAEGKYSIGQFNVSAIDLDKTYSYLEIPIKLGVYLNLENYYIDGISLDNLVRNTFTLLEEKTITIIIYNKASELSVSSDVKAEAGEDIDIVAQLKTGYINIEASLGAVEGVIIGENGEKLLLNEIVGFDKIEAILSPINKNAEDLLKKAKDSSINPSTFSVWHLFNRTVTYKLAKDSNQNPIGYTYSINLKLKDEYRNLDLAGYTENEWKFNININASSNMDLSKDVEISFVPQTLIGFRLENYSKLVSKAGSISGTTVSQYELNQPESSLIIPGESGLIKIFADYSYSYFENITISSSRETINGTQYFVRYQQLVYNKNKEQYESYAGITADGENLTLKKVSYIQDGEYLYDGVLFVRTILDEIVGVRQTFDITVNANTYDLDGNIIEVSRTKTVISQYRPGVYISVENALTSKDADNEQVYLVEENSSVSTIIARVNGYEFNVQPKLEVTAINVTDTLTKDEVTLVQQSVVEQDGAYVLRYSLGVYTNKPFKVTINMSLIDNGNDLTSSTKELSFYPVPYILNDVYVKGEANGGLSIAVNSSKNLELVWSTKSTTNSKIDQINETINELDYLKLFYINQINSNGQDYKKYFSEYLNATDTSFAIKQNAEGVYRIEALNKVSPIEVHFNLWYGYMLTESGFVVKFSEKRDESINCTQLITYQFMLNLTMHTTKDAPEPISTAEGLMSMAEGEHYILMEDITLENWVPLNTSIASLDGNGKVINIKSFNIAISASLNIGLFATVSENTILKNIVVNISTLNSNLYIRDDNVVNSKINFGFVAGVNNGLIYNCEVISIDSSRSQKTVQIIIGDKYDLTFGGLVGVNQGNITNSRVGTEYFQRLTYSGGSVYSTIMPCGPLYFKSNGIMAGFVGLNGSNCIISSSFVANTSVENGSNTGNSETNRTAGFVATNNGNIAYSYVKGLERNILTTKSNTSGTVQCVIYASGAGSVAGFVYLNTGNIHDCYSNTVCKSNSAGVAGFVYNTINGSVYQSYSASKVESGNITALATELPFVGVGIDKNEAQQLLSSENMLNCYYLDDGTEFDTNYKLPTGAVEPKALSLESFSNLNNLNNFSFITDSTSGQQLNGVWTYSTAVDRNRTTYALSMTALPELTSANTISRSLRVYPEGDGDNGGEKNIIEAPGYELGSQINPYIIRSVEEYQSVFVDKSSTTEQNKKYITGYVRFIDDISFNVNGEYIDIDTRSNYILGDKNINNKQNPTITVIDGNGMSISGVVINYTKGESGNLGLFSEVYNSVIKGLNIEYSTQTSSGGEVGDTTASYVGGVAGIAKNTYLIDLNLTGTITLRANNVVGGVVGRLTGTNSGLYSITSNLNVQAGNYNNSNIYNGEDSEIAYLSYAGGIAGIVDIGVDEINDSNFNINKLTVNSSSIRADRVGGIAGYFGKNVNAKRLTYAISNTSQIFGHKVAGGMVGDNYANIQLSQANREVDEQYDYDREFAGYINDTSLLELDNSDNQYGNLNAIAGDKIVGGFIGINYGGDISNSLTKANIGHNGDYGDGIADIAGGFIGVAYGGNLEYVYAQNYIDLVYDSKDADNVSHTAYSQCVGGLVGHAAYNINGTGSSDIGLFNVVVANWFDKNQIDAFATEQQRLINDTIQNNEIHIDYLIGKIDKNINGQTNNSVNIYKESSLTTSSPIVNFGVFNADASDGAKYQQGKIQNNHIEDAAYFDMEELYTVSANGGTEGTSSQQEIFDKLFAIWPDTYWDKNYTRFMPNLKLDDSTDYIQIAGIEDVYLLEQSPDKNFILVDNVNVGSQNANYIVNTNFTGVLIAAQKEDGSHYQFNITLSGAHTNNDLGAGFFKQTTGARIANITFNYQELTLHGSEFNAVGGVSALDDGSRFEQVIVQQSQTDPAIQTEEGASVVTLGSIVGSGSQSKIISCESTLQYDVSSNSTQDSSMGYIGGLIGDIRGYNDQVDENGNLVNPYDGLITSSIYSGKMIVDSNYGVNIGGIVANASYTRISDCKTMKEIDTDNNKNTKEYDNVEIYVSSANVNNIGGVVATYSMCSIAYCSTDIKVMDNEDAQAGDDPTETIDTTYNIGGIVGQIINYGSVAEEDIADSNSKITIDIVNASNIRLGGIVAEQTSTSEQGVNISRVATEISISSTEIAGNNGVMDVVDNITIGGIVALSSANPDGNEYGTTINNSLSIIDADIDYNSSLIGGGLIGQATGSYLINNSTAIGGIKANNSNGTHIEASSTSSLTVLGGLVGLADKSNSNDFVGDSINQEINNCYAVLTMSTASVYRGVANDLKHLVYTNSIVGYTDTKNQIKGNGVLYSSDYTLTFDKDNSTNPDATSKFEHEPINVTANLLLTNHNDLINGNIVDGFDGSTWFMEYGHLPLPKALQDILISMNILTYNTANPNLTDLKYNANVTGTAYSPIIIKNQTEYNNTNFNNGQYRYYSLQTDLNIDSSIDSLNGVILGNNNVINSSTTIINIIEKHSAISNITLILADVAINSGAVAGTNNGTVFMCGVQYNNITANNNFAGIVSTNNGVISNCYNMGNATINANAFVAGLVYNNTENASIEDSYFTGSFSGGTAGSALIYNNRGYIINCYSAGMAKDIVSGLGNSLTNGARYENVHYDYYANYTTIDDYNYWKDVGIIGLSTKEMQSFKQISDSRLFEGWKVYSMYNWETVKGNTEENVITTYNYGYPIHNFKQFTYDEGVKQIPIRVKATGNGTFNIIANQDGAITDLNYIINNVKGKLVYDEVENIYYENFSFIINNLGVLNLINTLSSTTSTYFELEVDMTLPGNVEGLVEDAETLLSNWQGIGKDVPFSGVFTTTTSNFEFNIDLNNSLYEMDRTLLDEVVDGNGINFHNISNIAKNENPKTITNLVGNALFANVGDGGIVANVILSNSSVNNAPVINSVGTASEDGDVVYETGVPTIYNVIVKDSVIANSTGSISGLVNIINDGNTLNIYSVNGDINIKAYNETKNIKSSAISGVINVNNGILNVKNSFTNTTMTIEEAENNVVSGFVNTNSKDCRINLVDAISIELISVDNNQKSISGFATSNEGSILTLNNGETDENSKIELLVVGITTEFLAGLVGEMKGGLVAGFDVVFASNQGDAYETNLFGGVVARLQGGQLGIRTETGDGDNIIMVDLKTATAKIYGGIAGIVDVQDSASIQNIEIKSGAQVVVKGYNDNNSAYGLIIGKYITKLSEIYYTLKNSIKFKVNDGANVGAIIGYSETNTFNFTNELQPLIKVYGLSNVGGFIGQYVANDSLKMEGNTWMLGEDEGDAYAQVEFSTPSKRPTSLTVAQSENFGGIIGYWNSTATLQAFGQGEEGAMTAVAIINNNPVLIFEDATNISWFKNRTIRTEYDYVLSNIGGVVGKSNAGVSNAKNEAIIGVNIEMPETNQHNGVNPIYGTDIEDINKDAVINNIMQYIYVGGIVGFISSTEVATLTNCINASNVFGMYAVGGLIGGTNNKIIVTETTDSLVESDVSFSVLGLVDVGGIIGRGYDVQIAGIKEGEEVTSTQLLQKIAGITNVGGMVGNATNVNISNYNINNQNGTNTLIIGNFNVGSLIGCADSATVNESTISNLIVYGSVFDNKYEIANAPASDNQYTAVYYIPSNIGGVVGLITGKAEFNLVTTNAEVKTEEGFTLDAEGNECTVNMTSNYMAQNIERGEYYIANEPLSTYLEKYYSNKGAVSTIRYYSVESGIGGFAGYLSGNVVANTYEYVPTFTDCQINGNIYASYGINVGGAVGYLKCDPQQVKLPTMSTQGINVAGKVFVGGYIGKSLGFGSTKGNHFLELNTVSNINVQRYIEVEDKDKDGTLVETLSGNGVGGIIGYVAGNVYNIKLTTENNGGTTSKIKVFNSDSSYVDSSYVGALVGRVDGNMTGCEIAPELCDAVSDGTYYNYNYDGSINGVIQMPKVYNYGGFAGLVDMAVGRKGENRLEILGKHYYAFAVDMIQNRDYDQGSTQFDVAEGVLTANAHYINTSDIHISASSLTGLYNNDDSNHNPTNKKASGWAKEYTLFRTMARVISQPNEETGDSVQLIYSANYITEVHTTFTEPEANAEDQRKLSDEIVYTIYQPIGQKANLYCKYGIAEQDDNFAKNYFTYKKDGELKYKSLDLDGGIDQIYPYELNVKVEINDDGEWVTEEYSYTTKLEDKSERTITRNNEAGRGAFWAHLSNYTQLGLSDSDFNDNGKLKWTVDDDSTIASNKHQYTFGFTYYESNDYLGSVTTTYFKFVNVFGGVEYKNDEDSEELTLTETTPDLYSRSGSLFEVTGSTILEKIGDVENQEKALAWIGGALAIIALAVALYFTGGQIVSFIVPWQYYSIMGTVTTIFKIVVVGGGLIGTACTTIEAINISKYVAQSHFYGIEDTSLGYLSSLYGREIGWQNGQLDPYYDSYIIITVKATGKADLIHGEPADGSYEKFLKEQLNVRVSGQQFTCELPLSYFNCTTARQNIKDVNKSVTIRVDDITDDSLKNIFKLYGVTTLTIPKYYKVDNEMYCYSGLQTEGRSLYPNYDDVAGMTEQLGYFQSDIIDQYGYAYIMESVAKPEHIVPESQKDYLLENYNMERTITQTVKHSLSSNLIGSTRKLEENEKSNIRWREINKGSADATTFEYETTFKYVGVNIPASSYYVTREISKIEATDNGNTISKRLYYNNGGEDVYVATIEQTIEEADPTSMYFTLDGTGTEISVVLGAHNGGKGLSVADMGLTDTNMYYVRNENGQFNISCNYILSVVNNLSLNIEGNYIYNLEEVPEAMLQSQIYVYKIKTNASVEDGESLEFSDFIENPEGELLTLNELTSWVTFDKYSKYSLSKEYKSLLNEQYSYSNGKLYLKNIESTYMSDRSDGINYIYRPMFGESETLTNFISRYVYIGYLEDGTKVELYTRFFYGDNFLEEEIREKTIAQRLLPTRGNRVETKDIIFAEGARVSLSAANSTIWLDYKAGEYKTPTSGSISCE